MVGKPTLALDRANTVTNYLRPKLRPGMEFEVDDGGRLSGDDEQFPRLRRVEVFIEQGFVSMEPPALRSVRSTP